MIKLQKGFPAVALLLFVVVKCICETVPEDLLTDNDEQLYKLQRDDLIDSIMDRIEPKTSEQTDEKVETRELPQENHDQMKDASEEVSLQLKSIFPSPSRFSSAYMETIKIHTSKNISAPVVETRVIENRTILESITSTQKLEKSILKGQNYTIRNIETSSSSFHENISTIYPNSTTITNSTSIPPTSQVLVSTMLTSTVSLSFSTLLDPHSISVPHDTALSTIQPTRTIFKVDQMLQSSSINETPKMTSTRETFSSKMNIPTAPPMSPEENSRKIPSIPDEREYGGFIPTTLKNAKGISFIYINVLLPIITGITGALLITFSILLFRCCRRRKLKKVRYFGAKHKRDVAHFDQMNLLTDTSDEEDFE